MKSTFIAIAFLLTIGNSFAQVKVLFDATKAQTAGQADWIVDADQFNLNWSPNAYTGTSNWHSNAQQIPTPAQSGITASTAENFWVGGLSGWGVDCAKKGYTVETLPYTGQITYGNSSNPQDLINYKVYIVCEPNILFTAAEKTAIMQFVQNGGGLFMVSDHTVSDRNGDGHDSPEIWNDLMTNNSVQANPFGITFDLQDFSQTSSSVVAAAGDSIIFGPMGTVTQVKWAGGTTMTVNPTNNNTVKAVVYKSGTSSGNNNVMFAYARYGNGKVAAIGDSSPCDDGTGNPSSNLTLYNGYFTDAAGNHRKLLMNATIWLATANPASGGAASITTFSSTTFCQGGSVGLFANTGTGYTYQWKLNGNNISGATQSSYTATQSGSYTVTLGGTGSGTSSPVNVTVNSLPAVPVVTRTGNVLSTGAYTTYQWYRNGALISGATQPTYTVTQTGGYSVRVTNSGGCADTSAALQVNSLATSVAQLNAENNVVSIYPNPAYHTSYISTSTELNNAEISVYGIDGKEVFHSAVGTWNKDQQIPLTLGTGFYVVKVQSGAYQQIDKLIIY